MNTAAFYSELRGRFRTTVARADLGAAEVVVTSRALAPEEAIGRPSRSDYPILEGKEVLVQATCCDAVGQAFTDHPSLFAGTLDDVLELPLDHTANTAVFIATLNAVMRHLHPELHTVHCRDDEPETCAEQLADELAEQGVARVGLVGLQPAILAALADRFGATAVRCLDRNSRTCGTVKHGVAIETSTDESIASLCEFADTVLCTGSTVVNHTLPGIAAAAAEYDTPIIYYGTTISGTAELLGFGRRCPMAT
jgi:uncharacterized protein (DUF4213/DUF364 family)